MKAGFATVSLFLNDTGQYEDDEEYKAHILENYNEHISQVIDMFPDFRMRLKLDKKTKKVMYGADIQSVFDICWYTFSRMVADVAPPVDEDLKLF
jgi:predicted metalloendopeptidase